MIRHYDRRRTLFAILLMMVMMLQMGIKTFHQHHRANVAEVQCSDCEHHKVHGGHLLSWNGVTDNCPLCQMLVSPYVPAEEVSTPLPPSHLFIYGITSASAIAESEWCITSPRGPPTFLL